MDSSLIMLILNLALLLIVVLGFLFGLHGVKKSALSLAFFIGAFIVTLIITPFVTKALLQINITVDGTTMSISAYIMEMVQQSALVKDLATKGSNMEALIQNAPQILGNIATYMALLIVVGFIFWIAYLITAHAIFKKKEKINPVTKSTPAHISATGNVQYIPTEKPEKKHRLLGGLVGALHAFIFMVVLLIPVIGATSLFGNYAYAQESEVETSAVIKTLSVDGDIPQENENDIQYTPTAKYIQKNVSPETLEIISAVNHSIIGSVCQVADVGDVVFNSIAKCNVNGEKVVLKDELDRVSKVYDNVEFLFSIDFSSAESIRSINFDKVRTAINTLTDSSVLKSIAPELTLKYLDWITADDISSLDKEVQDMVASIREELDQEPNMKELVLAIKDLVSTDEKLMTTLKAELVNMVDICEIVVKSDLLDYILQYSQAETEIDLTNEILTALHKDDNALLNNLIDKYYSSELVNLTTLTSVNYLIDTIQSTIQEYIGETPVIEIAKIKLTQAKSKFDSTVLKTITSTGLDVYFKLEDSKDENGAYDIEKFLKQNIKSLSQSIGKMLDNVKDMSIINEFGTLDDILTNLDKIEITINDEEPTTISKCFANLSLITENGFSFESELNSIGELAEYLLNINFTENVDGEETIYSFFDKAKDMDFEYIFKNMTSEQINKVIDTLSNSDFFKPLGVYALNYVNKVIQDQIGGDVIEFLPDDIDLSEVSDQIITIVSDVKDVMNVVDKFDDTKELKENLKSMETEEKETIVNALNNLQSNATDDGIFKEVYNELLKQAQDDSKTGLDGLSAVIEEFKTVDAEGNEVIDWASVVNKYLA